MSKISKRNASVYLTFSHMFGSKDTKLSVINEITDKPLQDTILLLSKIQYLDYMDQETKQSYLQYLIQKKLLTERAAEVVVTSAIINYQCLLTLWKYIFAYGNENMLKEDSSLPQNELLGKIITMSAKIGDFLYRGDSTSLDIELIRNLYFNNKPEVFASLGRSSYMYLDIASDKERYHEKEFIDIRTDFENKNPYSMKEYFAVITSLISSFSNINRKSQDKPVYIEPERYYNDTPLKEAGMEIVKELSFTFEEAKEWAENTLHNPWDFSLFQKKPLFNYDDQLFFPVCIPFLEDEVYEAFFYKIRKLYDDEKILGFLGRPFEEYASLVSRKSAEESKVPYQFIEEFSYGENKSKKSPDVMIRLGDKLAVFEVKNRRVRAASFLQGSEKSIKDDLHRMYIDSVKQAKTSITEILEKQVSEKLRGVKEVYIFSVTSNKCYYLGAFNDYVESELKEVKHSELVKGTIDLDIEEFEALCYLVSKKRPIFNIADEFFKEPLISFKNFLSHRHFPLKKPKFIDKRIFKSLDETLEAFGAQERVKDFKTKRK